MLDPEIDSPRWRAPRAPAASARSPRRTNCRSVFAEAIAAVDAGEVAVVDVRIEPGYGARHASGAMARKSGVTHAFAVVEIAPQAWRASGPTIGETAVDAGPERATGA